MVPLSWFFVAIAGRRDVARVGVVVFLLPLFGGEAVVHFFSYLYLCLDSDLVDGVVVVSSHLVSLWERACGKAFVVGE